MRLDNGLEVFIDGNSFARDVTTVALIVWVGRRTETEEEYQFSHIIEHMCQVEAGMKIARFFVIIIVWLLKILLTYTFAIHRRTRGQRKR